MVARLVFLAFFLLSAWYLFGLIKWLWEERTAHYALLIYLCLPIGIYYSRAIHIDFFALSLALGGVYYMLKGLSVNKWSLLVLSTGMFTLSFLVKAPYLFYFALPVLLYIGQNGLWKRFFRFAPSLLLPILAFWLWRRHTALVNGEMPDWSFLPAYFKLTNMGGWYFGNWEMRLDAYRWSVIFTRFTGEVAGLLGISLAGLGLLIPVESGGRTRFFGLLWAVGLIVYLLLFFPLNVIHNYYQIPFLPLVALLIAQVLRFLDQRLARFSWGKWAVALLLLAVIGENTYRAEYTTYKHSGGTYYSVNERYELAGHLISSTTPSDALVVLSDPHQDPRNPTWLYRCHRYGWAVHSDRLTEPIIDRLQGEGASYLCLLYQNEAPEKLSDWLADQPFEEKVVKTAKGIWKLRIVEL